MGTSIAMSSSKQFISRANKRLQKLEWSSRHAKSAIQTNHLAVKQRVGHDLIDEKSVLLWIAKAGWKWDLRPQVVADPLPKSLQHGCEEETRCDSHGTDLKLCQVTSQRQSHANHSSFRGSVCNLSNLSLISSNARCVDQHTTLCCLVFNLDFHHFLDSETANVESANSVDLECLLEGIQWMYTFLLVIDANGWSNTCTVDSSVDRCTELSLCLLKQIRHLLFGGHVNLFEDAVLAQLGKFCPITQICNGNLATLCNDALCSGQTKTRSATSNNCSTSLHVEMHLSKLETRCKFNRKKKFSDAECCFEVKQNLISQPT
eukprot:m.40875 g.40875  ORF g.40875 m.40875 type:complete len:318 (+) comp10479_c1_seq1:1825-2778(+)